MNRKTATRAIAMISVMVIVAVTPFITSASAILTYSTGYISPPDYPVTSNVQISPANPVVGDEVSCTYDFYDQSGDADHSTISWQLINSSGGYFIANGSSIETSQFDANTVIECYVVAFDGTNHGNTARTQILLGENISRTLPDLVPSIVYIKNNHSVHTDIIYEGEIIEMSYRETFEWNVSLMKLNQNNDFRIISYISNDTSGIQSLGSKYITASHQNQTVSLGNLSFEYGNGCYIATVMIFQLTKPGIYKDSFNFVLDVGNNDCSPYEETGKYNPDCITCPKVSWVDIYTTNTQKQAVKVKTTGLYPGKGYTVDVVLINETTPSVVYSESYEWNATHGAKVFAKGDLNLSIGSYCAIASLYENGEWVNTVRTCREIEEPEPTQIQFTYLRYHDYDITYYVDTSVTNMVIGKAYSLEVELVNDSTGYVIMSVNDTINATYLNWRHYMGDASLPEGYYCSNAKLYEEGVFIDEKTRCSYVVDKNASIVSNSISYNEYLMNHRTYTKVSYLTPGESYRVEMTLSNAETGTHIIVETDEWVATYGAKTFRIYDIDLPIGEFCLTTVLYENGSEVDRSVRCTTIICQYDSNTMNAATQEETAEEDDEASIIENVVEAILDVIAEVVSEMFAEARTNDSDSNEQSSDDATVEDANSTQ